MIHSNIFQSKKIMSKVALQNFFANLLNVWLNRIQGSSCYLFLHLVSCCPNTRSEGGKVKKASVML